MSDLDKLIAAVEAGDATRGDFYDLLPPPYSSRGTASVAFDAFCGSLDAALRLHEALLPGAHWELEDTYDLGFTARVLFDDWHMAHSANPARAWLLAILRALQAKDARDA